MSQKPVLVLKADSLSAVPGGGTQLVVGGKGRSLRELFNTAFGGRKDPKGPKMGQRLGAMADLAGRGAAAAATVDSTINEMQGGNVFAPLGAAAKYQANKPFTYQGDVYNPPQPLSPAPPIQNPTSTATPPGMTPAPPIQNPTTAPQPPPIPAMPAPQPQQPAPQPQPGGGVQQRMANAVQAVQPPQGQGQLSVSFDPAQAGGAAQGQFGTTQPTTMPQAQQTAPVYVQPPLTDFYTQAPPTPDLQGAFAALGTPQQAAPQQAASTRSSYPGLNEAMNTLSPQAMRSGTFGGLQESLPVGWGYAGRSAIETDDDWSPSYRPPLSDAVPDWPEKLKAFAPFCFPTEDGMLRKATPHEVGLYAALRYLGWL